MDPLSRTIINNNNEQPCYRDPRNPSSWSISPCRLLSRRWSRLHAWWPWGCHWLCYLVLYRLLHHERRSSSTPAQQTPDSGRIRIQRQTSILCSLRYIQNKAWVVLAGWYEMNLTGSNIALVDESWVNDHCRATRFENLKTRPKCLWKDSFW